MKLKQNFGLFFTKAFITLIDDLLKDQYTKYLKREDFLHLFYKLDIGKTNSDSDTVPLPRDTRLDFGRFGTLKQWKFPQLIDICTKLNIIYSTSYSNFEGYNYCKSYGYTQEFQSLLIDKEIEFQFCEISEKTHRVITKNYSIPTDPILLEHYNTICNLDIDLEKATEFAKKAKDSESFLRIVRNISTIYNKDQIIVIKDDKTGRIFTSFNMMKKELREFCTFNNKPLRSLDLKSSQPYLLASILLKENPNNKEIKKFYDLVTKKDLYDWLLEKWGGFDHMTYSESRTFAKKMLFAYLYKGNQGTNSVQDIIMKEFPEVYDIIKSKKRKEELWLTLQKLEASIFIPTTEKFLSSGCLSVHDSVYFVEDIQSGILNNLDKAFQEKQLINYTLS